MWQRIVARRDAVEAFDDDGDLDEVDLTADLDAFVEQAYDEPTTYRWSFCRDIADTRLIVLDSRAARVLTPHERSMLDAEEMAWLDQHMVGDVDHLLIGTSLPFLLAPGLHHLESFDEALAAGAWGPRAARFGEKLPAGRSTSSTGARSAPASTTWWGSCGRWPRAAAGGHRRPWSSSPATCTTATSRRSVPSDGERLQSRVLQAVCSPIRNPLPQVFRVATAAAGSAMPGRLTRFLARRAGVTEPPLRWEIGQGPWYENALAVLEVVDAGLRLRWEGAEIEGLDFDSPRVRMLADITVDAARGGGG